MNIPYHVRAYLCIGVWLVAAVGVGVCLTGRSSVFPSSISVLVLFPLVAVLRRVTLQREFQEKFHKLSTKIPVVVLCQYYTLFTVGLTAVFINQTLSFCHIVNATEWLDPAHLMLPEGIPDDLKVQLKIPEWLRSLSLMGYFAVLFTIIISIIHVGLHLPAKRGFDDNVHWYPSYSHDLTIQVLLMPFVYGLMALGNLVQLWQAFSGYGIKDVAGKDWQQAIDTSSGICALNMELADLYEAWALLNFANLCAGIVKKQVCEEAKLCEEALRVAPRFKELELLKNVADNLFKPMQNTVLLGVYSFVAVYAAKSTYLITVHFSTRLMGKLPDVLVGYDSMLDGMAFLASSLAIYNVVILEHSYNITLKKNSFHPTLKFLGVKFMVSVSYVQDFVVSIVMGKMCGYTPLQVSLCSGALIAVECLPLCLLLLCAWRPTLPAMAIAGFGLDIGPRLHDWYYYFDIQSSPQEEHPKGRLARESFEYKPQAEERSAIGLSGPGAIGAIKEIDYYVRRMTPSLFNQDLVITVSTVDSTVKDVRVGSFAEPPQPESPPLASPLHPANLTSSLLATGRQLDRRATATT